MAKPTVKYFTNLNTIKFADDFDEPLDDYAAIICNYSILKFSFGSMFNKSINGLPNSLRHLIFGYSFNRVIILSDSLTHLTFGYCFNQDINLPNSLTHLTFCKNFNKLVIFPNYLTHLTFGYDFNQFILIPNSLTHLTFGRNFNKNIELPENLLFIKMFQPSIEMVEKMPNHVKELCIYFDYCDVFRLENLPNSIEKLEINNWNNNIFSVDWIVFPISLKYLKINNKEIQLNII